MTTSHTLDCYKLLGVERNASQEEIKRAYHRALLTSHPDKRAAAAGGPHDADERPPIALLKEAYATLSQPELRAQHDADLAAAKAGPRPAAVLSLDDLQEGEDAWEGTWRWTCRCGGIFRISEAQMEEGQHLIGCSSCSEVIWVGYELAEEE